MKVLEYDDVSKYPAYETGDKIVLNGQKFKCVGGTVNFKHVPVKRQYTEKQFLYNILGALNRALHELSLACFDYEDYKLNDSRFGEIVKNDIERVLKVVKDEQKAIKHQIEIGERAG